MNCTSTNLVYVITSAGCGQNYIGETGDVLRNRVTVHKQQIRDPDTRMLGVSAHIDECAAGLTPQFAIFPFYNIPQFNGKHEKEQGKVLHSEI